MPDLVRIWSQLLNDFKYCNMNKTCQFNLRLTSVELEQLRNKSKSYKNLSAYIVHTCLNADDKLTINKLDFLESWADTYINFKSDLSYMNNNLNQLVKYLHSANTINSNVQNELICLLNSILAMHKQIIDANQNLLGVYKICF